MRPPAGVSLLIGVLLVFVALPGQTHAAGPYTYIPYDFGPDIRGNVWNIWAAAGSNVWDWETEYVDGFLNYSFKIHNQPGQWSFCSGSCRVHLTFDVDPTEGFGINNVVHNNSGVFPENNSNDHIYSVEIQWHASGYHVSVFDETDQTIYSDTDYPVPVTPSTHSAFLGAADWHWYWYFPWAGYDPGTPEGHADTFSAYVTGQEVTGTSGGGMYLRTTPLPVMQPQDSAPSVLFIPGLEGSRLYQDVSGNEEKRWEPGLLHNDILSLHLNSLGQSINPIYTNATGTIAQTDAWIFSTDIYRTFFEKLTALETEGVISGWASFPYDWRMSPEEIAENGTLYADGIHTLVSEVERLTENGNKVILVGHSNGGLVAKALMRRLEQDGKADLVSKVILVATPQLGTPDAIAAMLHGDGQGIPKWGGFIVSESAARSLAENMPGAYALLPSPAYFSKVAEPVIDLSAAPALRAQAGISDNTVDDAAELASFLTGIGGRTKPSSNDTATPNVLSATLLSDSTATHSNLDAWTPPPGIEVIQIAGWGIDTPRNITYKENRRYACKPGVCELHTFLSYDTPPTEDGDDTVVTPSVAANPDWTTYYLNLKQERVDENDNSLAHYNITETEPFQELVDLLVSTSSLSQLPTNVTNVLPPATNPRKRLAVHSPVSIDVYDNQGRHVGLTENQPGDPDFLAVDEEIPNSYYWQFGEDKYVGIPNDIPVTVHLKGLDTGTFTFEIQTLLGDVVQDTVVYEDLPVTASTTATLTISGGVAAPLSLDINGDGAVDSTTTENLDALAYQKLIKKTIEAMDIGSRLKKELVVGATVIEAAVKAWQTETNLKKKALLKKALLVALNASESFVKQALVKASKPGARSDIRISQTQTATILDMISELKSLIQ